MHSAVRPALAAVIAAFALAGCGGSSPSSSTTSPAATGTTSTTGASPQIGFEGVAIENGPLLGPASTTGTGPADGIPCGSAEQLAYHIHAHLAIYVAGALRALPGGIGIPGSSVVPTAQGPVASGGSCIYWLHTHAPDGIIHVESPTRRIYTLGDFFDVWRQPLSATRVAGASGPVSASVNGRAWTKSPRGIPLLPHSVIQLSVGGPVVPFHAMSWQGLAL